MKRIAVIGAGAYGSAMAHMFSLKAEAVTIISSAQEVAQAITQNRANPRFAYAHRFRENVGASTEYASLAEADLVIYACTMARFAQAYREIRSHTSAPLIATCKGISEEGLLCSEIAANHDSSAEYLYLAGPSFAVDIMCGRNVCLDIACEDYALACGIAEAFSAPTHVISPHSRVRSVEISAALKNMLAIVCGMHYTHGESCVAALISDGIRAIADIVEACGGSSSDVLCYSGVGDAVLTCMNTTSRNTRFGRAIADGAVWDGELAEGAHTARHLRAFLREHGVCSPFFEKYADKITSYLG